MFKKISLTLLFSAAAALCSYGGIVDNGDISNYPWVSSFGIEHKIMFQYFPELTIYHPNGLSRHDAWLADIKKAADENDYEFDEELEKLVNFVISPVTSPEAAGPDGKFLEFELYARGKRELFYRNHTEMPQAWKTLLALPVERRRYTTIPVIRAFCSYRMNRGGKLIEVEKALKKMIVSKASGCYDTQGCIADILKSVSKNPRDYNADERAMAVKLLFLKYYINDPDLLKCNRAGNVSFTRESQDCIKKYRNDIWYADIIWVLYTAKEEQLREMCKSDPFLRDIIVCHGLTNRMMEAARKVAMEFYKESVINYPAAAMRLPIAEAIKLLASYPEYNALRDQLIIKTLEGVQKIEAIDEYIAKYPDFAKQKNENVCVWLYSHAELHALAGAELFKLGKPYEAAERWVKGCTAEDMAMVAEQVMTIEELKEFCNKHFDYSFDHDQNVFSLNCARIRDSWDRGVIDKNALNFMVRNILARRLMREERFEEAERYFTGRETHALARKFFNLKYVIDSDEYPRVKKLEAMLNMAHLVRFSGNKLFGTFLEPDNLICNNNFPCTWGTKQSAVKLNKPDLPRFSYRYRAAELYAKAAELTDDSNLKGMILWTAGSILKHRDPKAADIYFKKLYKAAPELTENNWFLPLKKVPDSVRAFYVLGK